MQWIRLLEIFLFFLKANEAIHITGLDVPNAALAGDEVRLRCDYEMDIGSSLYSLKWYKDGKEFYRHVPGNGQLSTQKCSISASTPSPPGITIDCWGSSEREVVLTDVSRATSGEYKCEVIGDHPAFRREERKAKLIVYSEPLEKPLILGAALEYELGNKVTLNCSSKNSEYFPMLSWFINGQPAKEHEILYPYMPQQGILGLIFSADQTRFIHGQVKVTCRANLSSLHVQSASKTLSIPRLLRPEYYSQGSTLLRKSNIMIVVLCLRVAFI